MDIEKIIQQYAETGNNKYFEQLWNQYNQNYSKSDWVQIPDLERMDYWSQNAFKNLLNEYINDRYGDRFDRLLNVLTPIIEMCSTNKWIHQNINLNDTDEFKKLKEFIKNI